MVTLIDSFEAEFTIYSDLRNINTKDKSGELVTTKINLWDSISNKNYFENPFLYDGDVIVVENQSLNESEIYTISNSAFSQAITRYIGAVLNQEEKINTNKTWKQYLAGGLRRFANQSKIKLVRINLMENLKQDLNIMLNYYQIIFLIYLKDGDIIIIQNNNLKKHDLLSDIVLQ